MTRPAPPGPGTLTPAEAHAQAGAGRIALVDIRTPAEWTETGIPDGAAAIDMRRDDFQARIRTLLDARPSQSLAVICARGVRSRRLAERLAEAGFGSVLDVPQGMLGSRAGPGWLQAGLPVDPAP